MDIQNIDTGQDYIDLIDIFKKILSRKILFIKVWAITFILACIWILPQPREYVSTVVMVPETAEGGTGTLSSIASSFGINLGNFNEKDAYYPTLYPNVISSNEFLVDLLKVDVTTSDTEKESSMNCSYLDHVTKYSRKNPFLWPLKQAKKGIINIFQGNGREGLSTEMDSYRLSREERETLEMLREKITCGIDKKTSVITITVLDQDSNVAAEIADTVSSRLQEFITEYRTHKARIDLDHFIQLKDSAYQDFKTSSDKFSTFCDSHKNASLQSYISKRNELQNDLSVKQSILNAIVTQVEGARAKLQEKTPAFTTLSRSGISSIPEKPRRTLFVLAMLIISTFGTILWIFKQEVVNQLRHIK